MAHVGVTGLFNRVVIDVDDVVEHAHRGGDGLLQFGMVKHLGAICCVLQMLQKVD